MTKEERLRAALAREPVDRQPVSFWRHWPVDDQNAERLARATLSFQQCYDFDFIKVTPSHTFCLEGWGAETEYRGREIGDRDYLRRVIEKPEDLDGIGVLSVRGGAWGRQLCCLELVREGAGQTPFLQTIFNPLAVIRYLAGDREYPVYLRRHPERVHRALDTITRTTAEFVRSCLEVGCAGIFISTASASYDELSEEEYRQFGVPYDLRVLEAAGPGWLNILHIHGMQPMFDLLADYPVQAVNWHDRLAEPSLGEGARRFKGAVIGGVNQWETMLKKNPEDVAAEVHDAIRQTGGRGLIVGTGCTFPLTTPDGNLLAARAAVEPG